VKYGLQDAVIEKIRGVFTRYPQVEQAILYGSRAKDTYKNGSDIDLTLRGGEDLTLNVLYRISDDLDDLLLPYTIDLSILSQISSLDILDHIQRVGLTFYEKTPANSIPAETA